MSATKYIDICIQPIPKKNLAEYKKLTKHIGKLLIKHGALASYDYSGDDENATKYSFPNTVKINKGEVIIVAIAEFKSKAHRDKIFKLMEKDPAMDKIEMTPKFIDPKRAVMGGFKLLVAVH